MDEQKSTGWMDESTFYFRRGARLANERTNDAWAGCCHFAGPLRRQEGRRCPQYVLRQDRE